MLLCLYAILPILCVAAIPSEPRPGQQAERLVFGVAFYAFLLYSTGVSLGLAGQLSTQTYLSAILLVVPILCVLAWRNRILLNGFPWRRWIQTRRGRAALILLLIAVCSFATQVGFDGLFGMRHPDGLWYHIPRVLFWLQQGNFAAWPTPVWAQIGLPVGADIILGHKMLLGGGWAGTGYITGIFSVGAAACVYLVALDLRLPRWQALMAAILFYSFPALGMRIWSANSDIVAAFPVLAAYVALRRMHNTALGLAVFLILNGLAIACKPTVAPHMALLGLIGLWQSRHRIVTLGSFVLPGAAAVLAVAMVFFSYWPVYQAFNDFQGGDGGRRHKVATVQEFASAVALSATHWLAEPLGYLHTGDGRGVKALTEPIYKALGGEIKDCPESWTPSPNQDVSRSGLASLWFIPGLLAGLSPHIRIRVASLFFLGFISLSGMVHFRPWNSRYTIILLAGFALMWAGSKLLRYGNRRWILAGLVCLNLLALLGVSLIVIYKDRTTHSQPGGAYALIESGDRDLMRRTLRNDPLLVLAQESFDALLTGPDVDFDLKYLICPNDGDWEKELRKATDQSRWLAIYHGGGNFLVPGPVWRRPGGHVCSSLPLSFLDKSLAAAGWTKYKSNNSIDLWVNSTDIIAPEQ